MTATVEAPPVDPETGGAWDRDRIFNALELEDAWESAKRLMAERDHALANKQAFERAYSRSTVKLSRMVQGISNLLWSEEGKQLHPDIREALRNLILVGDPDEGLN